VGDLEARASAFVESTLGYHPDDTEILTGGHEAGHGTLLGGQFDWGGRLLKCNGGAQRFPQNGWKSFEECKGRREPDCDTHKWSRDESRT
jgi:hypothetical protein